MKNIVTIVGARPQFVKAAVLSRCIQNCDDISEYIIHTGQHYDENMSDIFFKEMDIPTPDINLEVGSGSHGETTGKMLTLIEEVLLKRKPDALVVYGDTNSTLAGALAAAKLHIPVVHIEAGLRSFNKRMPEEINRITTDHMSDLLFCPTETAVSHLKSEGITKGVHNVGDIMYDASLFYRKQIHEKKTINRPDGDFYLITLHRAENTDSKERLTAIVEALNEMDHIQGVLPLHPRTKKYLDMYGLSFKKHITLIDPIGYFDMLYLESECSFIMTDSGGVQKEAYFFDKPCITMRDETEWVETVDSGWNTLVGADKSKIKEAVKNIARGKDDLNLYGDGDCGNKILNVLLDGV